MIGICFNQVHDTDHEASDRDCTSYRTKFTNNKLPMSTLELTKNTSQNRKCHACQIKERR